MFKGESCSDLASTFIGGMHLIVSTLEGGGRYYFFQAQHSQRTNGIYLLFHNIASAHFWRVVVPRPSIAAAGVVALPYVCCYRAY